MGVCRCACGSVSGASFAPRSYAHVGRSPRSATRSRRFFAIVEHARGDRCTFDEMRTGLDHISFSVPASKLENWQKRLREEGIRQSEPAPAASGELVIVVRDPDNIQAQILGRRP